MSDTTQPSMPRDELYNAPLPEQPDQILVESAQQQPGDPTPNQPNEPGEPVLPTEPGEPTIPDQPPPAPVA